MYELFGHIVGLLLEGSSVAYFGNFAREIDIILKFVFLLTQSVLLERLVDGVLVKVLAEDFALEAFAEVHYYAIIFTPSDEILVSFIRHDKRHGLNLTLLQILPSNFLHHIAQIMECFLFLDELF